MGHSFEIVNRRAALFFAVGYIVFGLILANYAQFSRLGIVFASLLFANTIFRPSNLTHEATLYLVAMFYIVLTWLWTSSSVPLAHAIALVTIAFGATGLCLSVRHGAIRLDELVWLLALPGIASLLAWLVGYEPTWLKKPDSWLEVSRYGGLSGGANTLTSQAFLPLIAYLLIYYPAVKEKSKLSLLLVCVGLAVFAFFVSGSRRGVLIFVILLPLLIACLSSQFGRSAVVRVSAAFMIWIGIAVVIVAGGYIFEDVEAIKRFQDIDNDKIGSSSELRRYFVEMGIELFNAKMVFGHGFDAFRHQVGLGLYSHNNLIEIAVNTGTVGVLLYYTALAVGVFGFVKHNHWNPLILVSVVLLLGIFEMTGVSFNSRTEQVFTGMVICIRIHDLGPAFHTSNIGLREIWSRSRRVLGF